MANVRELDDWEKLTMKVALDTLHAKWTKEAGKMFLGATVLDDLQKLKLDIGCAKTVTIKIT